MACVYFKLILCAIRVRSQAKLTPPTSYNLIQPQLACGREQSTMDKPYHFQLDLKFHLEFSPRRCHHFANTSALGLVSLCHHKIKEFKSEFDLFATDNNGQDFTNNKHYVNPAKP